MPSRIAILEGYVSPFGSRSKKRSSNSKGLVMKQQKKMKVCAKKCKGGGKYRSCMRVCLRKGSRRKSRR